MRMRFVHLGLYDIQVNTQTHTHTYLYVSIYICKRSLSAGQKLVLVQDGLTGSAWGDWANYTASPLRAFENELGVQAPVGFWDPAGFTADGSTENFARRRQTELKHGRISMLATWSKFGIILLLVGLFQRHNVGTYSYHNFVS